MQLEQALQTQTGGMFGHQVISNSTLTAIMETKDARIATLEKEINLLETELERARISALSLRESLLLSSPIITQQPLSALTPLQLFSAELSSRMPPEPVPPPAPALPPLPAPALVSAPSYNRQETNLKRQVSFLLNNVQIRKDGKMTVIM